ncbi:MAG: hypothetical protein AAFR21_11620 [Pseudomonadota bacterium]
MSLQAARFTQETESRSQLRLPKPFLVTPLQTTALTIYTALESTDFRIEHLWVSNVTGSAATFDLYQVPDGGTAATANALVYQESVAANTSKVVEVAKGHLLQPETILQALCSSNNAINLGGWGYDILGEYG